MSGILIDDIIAGAAEVGACLAVDIVDADGEGLGLEDIRFAVMDAVVVAVRTFIVQRKLSEVLDEFPLDAKHRGDIVGGCEAVGFRDMTDRTAGFHGIGMGFVLTRFLVDIGGVSDRYVFVIAPTHDDIFTHRVKGIISSIIISILTGGQICQRGTGRSYFGSNHSSKLWIHGLDLSNDLCYVAHQFLSRLAAGNFFLCSI